MNIYSSKATASIHLRIDYQCCYCQKENRDNSQYLFAKAESHGSPIPSAKLTDEARQRVAEKMEKKITDLGRGNLQSAHLKCACFSCGRRQPWSSFMEYPVWAIVLCVLGIILGFTVITKWNEAIISPRLLIIPMMFIPVIVIAVRNRLAGSKVSRLDPQYLPRITKYTDPEQAKD